VCLRPIIQACTLAGKHRAHVDLKVLHWLQSGAVSLKRLRTRWNRLISGEVGTGTKADQLADNRVSGGELKGLGAARALNGRHFNPDGRNVRPWSNRVLEPHNSAHRHSGLSGNVVSGWNEIGLPLKSKGPTIAGASGFVEKVAVGSKARLKPSPETDHHVGD